MTTQAIIDRVRKADLATDDAHEALVLARGLVHRYKVDEQRARDVYNNAMRESAHARKALEDLQIEIECKA